MDAGAGGGGARRPAASVPSCPSGADSWSGAPGGSWSVAGNWTAGVPSSGTYVCIAKDSSSGSPVSLGASTTIAGLLIGSGEGLSVSAGTLSISGGTTATGLEGALEISAGAAISTAAGIDVVNGAGGAVTDGGTFAVAGTFDEAEGTVAVGTGHNPVLLRNGASMQFTGTGASSFLVSDQTTKTPSVSLSGNIAAGQSFAVGGEDLCGGAGTTTVDAAASFTNAGTLALEHDPFSRCGNGSAVLALPVSATLTNHGTIVASGSGAAPSDDRTISGKVLSTGTVAVGTASTPSYLELASGSSFTNDGAVDVATGATLAVDGPVAKPAEPAASFTNASGGTLTNEGIVAVGGSFTEGAGTVATATGDNPVYVRTGSSIDFAGKGSSAFLVTDPSTDMPSVSLSGNIAAGQSLAVGGEDLCGGAGTTTVTASASFTNAGTITLAHDPFTRCGNGSAVLALAGAATLTNSGTIAVTGSGGAPSDDRVISGRLVSTGTVTVGTPSTTSYLELASGGSFTNEGALQVSTGSTVSIDGPSTSSSKPEATFTNTSGSITNEGVVAVGGSFTEGAGTVATATGDNPVYLRNGSSIDFAGKGSSAFLVTDPLSSAPSVSLSGNIAAGQSFAVGGEDLCGGAGTTTVKAAATFANAGTITLEHDPFTRCGNGSAVLALADGERRSRTAARSPSRARVEPRATTA